MILSEALIALGSVLAAPIYTAWRRKRGITPENTTSLQQLIATDHRDTLTAYNIHADIQWLASYTAQSLLPIFKLDGSDLSDSDQAAVALALADTIREGGPFPDFLLAHNLDLHQVTQSYKRLGDPLRPGLSEKCVALYDACLPELVRRLIAISAGIPGFNSKFHQRLLANQAHFIDQGRPIIDELSRFLELHKSRSHYLLDNFTYELKAAIMDRFGSVYILGLDTADLPAKLPLDVSYLSVRAELTKARSIKDDDVFPVDIPSEYILRHSKRILLRGNAGSGKTTLLQWLAIQCVNKSFPENLTIFHGYMPFFIRLRDFYDAPLPTGRQLFSSVSPFLVESLDDGWLRDILYRGRGLFLIDGLDEISEGQRNAVQQWLADLTRHTPESTFVVTSRPTAVKSDFLAELNFDEFFLKPMTPDEVDSFIEYWHDALKETQQHDETAQRDTMQRQVILSRLLQQNRSLKRFASTPLLAAVICTLNYNAKLDLITDRVDLYSTTARLLYPDRVLKKEIRDPVYDAMSRAEKEAYLAEIALWMIWNGKTECTVEQIARVIARGRGTFREEVGGRDAKEMATTLVNRSGVLQEVTPESIEFLHKTFQEYFGGVAAVKTENEMAVATRLDLTEWSELFRILIVQTNHPSANRMIEAILEIAQKVRKRRVAYVLLAAAATQECLGIAQAVRGRVRRGVARLVPPKSSDVVFELAQAGELVVPLLRYKESWTTPELTNSIAVLGQIDLPESGELIYQYAREAPLDIELIVRLFEAIDYRNDPRFGETILRLLKRRNSKFFYQKGQSPRLYAAANSLLEFSKRWPRVQTVVIDCRWGLHLENALLALDEHRDRVQGLTVVSREQLWSAASLRRFELLTELNIFGGRLSDINFLSSLGKLRTFRVFEARIDDWDGVEYSDVRSIFVRGLDESSAEALGPVAERWANSRRRLFVDVRSLDREMEVRDAHKEDEVFGVSRRDRVPVWHVAEIWSKAEQESVVRRLGLASPSSA